MGCAQQKAITALCFPPPDNAGRTLDEAGSAHKRDGVIQKSEAWAEDDRQGASQSLKQGLWSHVSATKLQEAVDNIFGETGRSLLNLEFSFTIADPFLEDCPLIGCSIGFTKLCGYDLHDIVGRNCRFLIDPVPSERIDNKMRQHTKEFCQAVRRGVTWIPPSDYKFTSKDRPSGELVAMQTNARKDGSLFNNLFYMKVFDIGVELGEEQPYIVGLQSELKGGEDDLSAFTDNLAELDAKMEKVERELSSGFFVQCSMSRQLLAGSS